MHVASSTNTKYSCDGGGAWGASCRRNSTWAIPDSVFIATPWIR